MLPIQKKEKSAVIINIWANGCVSIPKPLKPTNGKKDKNNNVLKDAFLRFKTICCKLFYIL